MAELLFSYQLGRKNTHIKFSVPVDGDLARKLYRENDLTLIILLMILKHKKEYLYTQNIPL